MAIRNLLDWSASEFANAVQTAIQHIIGQHKLGVVTSLHAQKHTDVARMEDYVEIRLLVKMDDNPFHDARPGMRPHVAMNPDTDLLAAHFLEEWAQRERRSASGMAILQQAQEASNRRLQEINEAMMRKQIEMAEKMLTNGLQDLLKEPFKLTLAPSDGQSDKIRVNKPRSITGAWVDEAEKLPDPPPAPKHERWLK